MKRAGCSAALAIALCAAGAALAQSGGGYTMRRHTEDGGGGRMSGAGGVVLQGTVGQPDANAVVPSGAQGYALRGGFWVAGVTIERGDALFANGFE